MSTTYRVIESIGDDRLVAFARVLTDGIARAFIFDADSGLVLMRRRV